MGIDAIIALIGSLVPVINSGIGFINRTIDNLKQNAEMTPENWSALRAKIADLDSVDEPDWMKTDAEKATVSKS